LFEKDLNLLKPIKINKMTVKNRMVMPAMGTLYGNEDNTVSGRLIKYIEARARGGVGLIILEYTAVAPGGRAAVSQLGIWDDRFIDGLREIANVAHRYDVKVGIQLHHAGRASAPEVCGSQPAGPSPVAGITREVPKELTGDEINEIVMAFSKAAGRAKAAGYDFVEIHGAHGYLISQFMTPYANKRTDDYGVNLDGFLRFPVEVAQAVREEVGPDFPVLFRISAEEHVEGGKTLKDSVYMAKRLAEAGVDALHVSSGLLESRKWIITPATVEPGLNVSAAEAVKAAVNIPVIVVGKIHTPGLAEEIIKSGKADMVALGRALLADPEFPNKVAAGRWDDICMCVHCLQGCSIRPVTCIQNPELGREGKYELKQAATARNVLVIGGGPAGLEAARVALSRGHRVTLYDKEKSLGGLVGIASVPPYKSDLRGVIDFRISQVANFGVKVVLGKEVTIEDIKMMKPDAVVLATGGVPIKPNIPGIDGENVVFAWDVLKGSVNVGDNVLVVGGGGVGAETADYLATQGKKVTIIEMLEKIAAEMPSVSRLDLLERLRPVTVMTSTRLLNIGAGEIIVESHGQTSALAGIDTVVLAIGSRPVNVLAEKISSEEPEIELHVIGDALSSRNIQHAIAEGIKIGNIL